MGNLVEECTADVFVRFVAVNVFLTELDVVRRHCAQTVQSVGKEGSAFLQESHTVALWQTTPFIKNNSYELFLSINHQQMYTVKITVPDLQQRQDLGFGTFHQEAHCRQLPAAC